MSGRSYSGDYRRGRNGYNRSNDYDRSNGGGYRQRKSSKYKTPREANCGALTGILKEGKNKGLRYVKGYRKYAGQPLVQIDIMPYEGKKNKTKECVSKASGVVYETRVAIVKEVGTHKKPEFFYCLMEKESGKTVIKDINWVINPATGYCGRIN